MDPAWRSFTIDVLPMSDSLNLNNVRVAEDFLDDAIISNSDSVGALRSEFLRAVRKRVVRELSDGLDDAYNFVTRGCSKVESARAQALPKPGA
jgi:hypothetical protein